MRLFDSHCHLQDDRLLPEVDAVLGRAAAAGVIRMVCCGSSEEDWRRVLDLSKRYEAVIPAFGVHPWYVDGCTDGWFERLEQLLQENPTAAVGEIGLDHALEERNDELQLSVFYRQLQLAHRLGRPASIHCRRAWGSLAGLLRREPEIARGCVIHSYSGPAELVEELQRHGLLLSFSGSITHERNRRARKAVVKVAREHLLLETDSPDIPPEGHSGPNEPCTITQVAATVAELRVVPVEQVAEDSFTAGSIFFTYHSDRT
jgi:TatD DNase family protein